MTFVGMLKELGFKKLKSHAPDVTYMVSADGETRVEIYTEAHGKWAWARGKHIPEATGCPGGHTYHDPKLLLEALTKVK